MNTEKKPLEEQTIEELLLTYKGYIYKIAQSLTNDEYINKELIQEGQIYLFLAKERYNPDSGNFHSYIGRYIKGGMLMYLNYKQHTITYGSRKTKEFLSDEGPDFPTYHSFDEPLDDDFSLVDLIADEYDDEEYDDDMFNKMEKLKYIISNLKSEEIKLINLCYKDNLKQVEIAKIFNVSPAVIYHRLGSLRKKIKKRFTGNYIPKKKDLNQPKSQQKYCCWNKNLSKWIVTTKLKDERKYYGCFKNQDEAESVAKKIEQDINKMKKLSKEKSKQEKLNQPKPKSQQKYCYWHKNLSKWIVLTKLKDERKYYGIFKNQDEAESVAKIAEQKIINNKSS